VNFRDSLERARAEAVGPAAKVIHKRYRSPWQNETWMRYGNPGTVGQALRPDQDGSFSVAHQSGDIVGLERLLGSILPSGLRAHDCKVFAAGEGERPADLTTRPR
jgi:hypothetical protein